MSFPKYPKYQDTGLTWLAEAPEHWRVIAPKRVMKSCSGGTLIKGECAAEPEEGLFPAFSASGQDVWVERADYSAPGIVLSAVGARCGKTFKADGEWGVVANTHCLFPEGNQSRDFFWYLTNREDWWETGGTAQPFVKVRETLARTWCLPPANEQGCISNFLDCETAKIDALIAEQQRLIELLQEKKQAVISHAVTKGLNPNAPMKHSGVEWLGEVPEHWEVMGLTKTIGPVVDYRGKTPTKCDEGTLLVTAKNIRNGEIDYTLSEEYVDPLEAEQLLQRGRPVIGDVLFTMEAPLGQVALVDREDIALAQRVVKFRGMSDRMTNDFLMWWLVGSHCQHQLNSLSTGSTALGIKASKLSAVTCVVPPLEEQTAISERIRELSKQITGIYSTARSQIDLLQERRSALISAAVTGQIDVRGLALEVAA